MSDEDGKEGSDAEAAVEREIRKARKFSPQEALARMAGPGAMKGASPVSRQKQAEIEIRTWLGREVPDAAGALKSVLSRQIDGSPLLLLDVERPLAALKEHCSRLLKSDALLMEFVREVDTEWGRVMDERPHFERSGGLPHPDDPYTLDSVRDALSEAMQKLA